MIHTSEGSETVHVGRFPINEDPAISGGVLRRAREDSNLRSLAPQASALSTELRAPM